MRRRLRKKQARDWARKERKQFYANGSLFFGNRKYSDELTLWIETSQMKTFIEGARGCSLREAIRKYIERQNNIRSQSANLFMRGAHAMPYVFKGEVEPMDLARQRWTEQDRINAERRSELRQMRAWAIGSMFAAYTKKEGEE